MQVNNCINNLAFVKSKKKRYLKANWTQNEKSKRKVKVQKYPWGWLVVKLVSFSMVWPSHFYII